MRKVFLVMFFLVFSLVSCKAFAQQQVQDEIVVYYFHGNARCVSCKKIEQYTGEAVVMFFQDQIDSKAIRLSVVNIDEPANKHFVSDYQLYTKAVVLSSIKNGQEIKYKNLEKVWQYIRNKDKFYQYIQDEIQAFQLTDG